VKSLRSHSYSRAVSKDALARVVAGICGYELVAINSRGMLPTLTELNKRTKHVLGGILVSGLALHLFADWPKEEILDDIQTLNWRIRLRRH
jgi:hypothetical protein